MKYWITVVSKEHIQRGLAGGFIQANHGKPAPLKRMARGDWVINYSPKQSMNGGEPVQAFTAIGRIADGEVFQQRMSDDFIPYRRRVDYYHCTEAPVAPMINELAFIPNKKSWGYPFRFGFFEITEPDFELIKRQMIKGEPKLLNQ